MSYFKTCPRCGAHLDPGDVCDCKERTAQSAANALDGKAETFDRVSAYIVQH